MSKSVHLDVSKYGRPIIWIAHWHYDCLPGAVVSHIDSTAVFASREEAIRWCRFQLRFLVDWEAWQSEPGIYSANCDDPRCSENTFIATVEGETKRGDNGEMGKWKKVVTVSRKEVCAEFDWWAKTADGDWNRPAKEIS